MLKRLVNSKSKTFLAFCFCFLGGITVASIINRSIDFVYIYTALIILLPSAIIIRKNKTQLFTVLCLLLLAAGFVRYALALPRPFDLPKGEQTFNAVVHAEPDVRQDGVRYIVSMNSEQGAVSNDRLTSSNRSKKIYFKYTLYPRYEYGDVLRVICELQKPEPFDGFRYDMYLLKFGVTSVCQRPEIEKIGAGEGSIVLDKIYTLKQKTAERISKLWHEPYAGFMAGLLYGYKGGLGALTEQFNRTGVTHIIAISGYNISIIAQILLTICVYMWIPRKKAFYLVTIGLILFVIFTGLNGSVVRAGIMGFLAIFAKQIGRLNRMGNVMALTAVLMTLHNPFLLIWDAGFQLSFLATLGLVYIAPILENRLRKMPELFGIKETLIATLSAIVATLPLILYQFGRLSIVAPVVNILILWIIPWLMLLGFASVVASFIYYPLGVAMSYAAWIGMVYVTGVVHWFAELPFASVNIKVSLVIVVGIYVVGVIIIRQYHQKQMAIQKILSS